MQACSLLLDAGQICVIGAWMHDTDVATIVKRTAADISDNGVNQWGQSILLTSVTDFDSPNSAGTEHCSELDFSSPWEICLFIY